MKGTSELDGTTRWTGRLEKGQVLLAYVSGLHASGAGGPAKKGAKYSGPPAVAVASVSATASVAVAVVTAVAVAVAAAIVRLGGVWQSKRADGRRRFSVNGHPGRH